MLGTTVARRLRPVHKRKQQALQRKGKKKGRNGRGGRGASLAWEHYVEHDYLTPHSDEYNYTCVHYCHMAAPWRLRVHYCMYTNCQYPTHTHVYIVVEVIIIYTYTNINYEQRITICIYNFVRIVVDNKSCL